MPQGQPRPVPDPEGDRYDEMLRQERLRRARADAAEAGPPPPSVGHPELLESLIPVWGSGREAVADFQEGDYAGAALNGALAASDLFLAGATLEMAQHTGRDQTLGSIEKGKVADFFLVPGDPTKDLKAIKTVRMVVRDGVVYFPSEVYPKLGVRPFTTAPVVTPGG
ncbi:MAG: amidohydrolase family protein [Phenylobacterium sp.]